MLTFSPFYITAKVNPGTDFSTDVQILGADGKPIDDLLLSGWTFSSIFKRSPQHDVDAPETFFPVTTLNGTSLNIAGTSFQTQDLRPGRCVCFVYGKRGSQKQLVGTVSYYISEESAS